MGLSVLKIIYAISAFVLFGTLVLGGGAVQSALGQTTPHLVIIVFENKNYSQVIGSPYAPYINNTLLPEAQLFTHYYSPTHSSLPNYLIITSGDNAGCVTDLCPVGFDAGENLFHQMDGAAISWKAYLESMPSACYPADKGRYLVRHNPPVYYSNLGTSGDGTCATNDVQFSQMASDLTAQTLPAFSYVAPNKFNDMHNDQKQPPCQVGLQSEDEVCQGDTWLSKNLPTILSDGGLNDVTAVLAWDEAATDNSEGGGLTPLIVVGPNACQGCTQDAPFNHYGLEDAIADWFGLPELHPAVPAL
jgi:Phosphoesterase family